MKDITSMSNGYVNIAFGPCWNYVAVIRSFLQNFVSVSIPDQQVADKLSLAVSELLENAVKYSADKEIMVNLRINQEEKKIHVQVENALAAGQREVLEKELQEVNSGTPLEAYLRKLQVAAKAPVGKSGLGLARIRNDTNAALTMDFKDDKVTVKALFDF